MHNTSILVSVVKLMNKLSQPPPQTQTPLQNLSQPPDDSPEPILISLLPLVSQITIKHLTLPESTDLVADCLSFFGNLILVPAAYHTPEDMDLAIIMLPVVNKILSPTGNSDLVDPALRCLVQMLRRGGSSPIVWSPFYKKLVSYDIIPQLALRGHTAGLASLIHTTGDYNQFPLAPSSDSSSNLAPSTSPLSPSTTPPSLSTLSLVCEPLCTALLFSPSLLDQRFLSVLLNTEVYQEIAIANFALKLILRRYSQSIQTVYSILQILLHTSRNSVEVSEVIAHGEEQQRLLTRMLTNPKILHHIPNVAQAVILLLLGAILAQVPWAAEIISSAMEVEAIVKFITSTDLIVSSCATYMAAMLLAQLNGREREASPYASKLALSVEGTSFGYPHTGMFDGPVLLILRAIKRSPEEYGDTVLDSGLWDSVCHQINVATAENELSPLGLLSAVRIVYEILGKGEASRISHLARNNLIGGLCSLLQPSHLNRLNAWPSYFNGGAQALAALVTQVVGILYLPFANLDAIDKDLMALVTQQLLDQNLVSNLVAALPRLPPDYIELPTGLLSRLVLGDPLFATQFAECGGLGNACMGALFHEENSIGVVVDTLLIISQLARSSSENYEKLHQADLYAVWYRLLEHPDPNVRAKMCNLLGNLCKHSAYFYTPLKKYGLIPLMIDRCSDSDHTTRKFACFAVGNAGFHNDRLYNDLRTAIPAIVSLLDDPEDKTRSNAAGALGNLARNSSSLCYDLIHEGAMQRMVAALADPKTRKIALFSLGNFCVHKECKEALEEVEGFEEAMEHFAVDPDPTVRKYLTRIKRNLS